MKTSLSCSLAALAEAGRKHSLTMVVAAALLGSGCAGPEAMADRDTPSEREYPTGSNIPRKKNAKADSNTPMGLGVRVQSREDLERLQGGGRGIGKGDGVAP